MDDLTRRLRVEIPAREPEDAFMARLASIAGLGVSVAPNSLRRFVRLAVAAVVALLLLSGAAYAATRVGNDHPAPPRIPAPHSTAPKPTPTPTPTPTHSTPLAPTSPPATGDDDDHGEHGEDEDEQGRDQEGGDDASEDVSGEDDSHTDGTEEQGGADDVESDGSGTSGDSGESPD